jgi:hypothetical protein
MAPLRKRADHNTRAYGEEVERQIDRSFAGMAHFAGTGPAGETCSTCIYHDRQNGRGSKANGFEARCLKATQLFGGYGPRVPAKAAACRHHEGRPGQ